MHRACIAYRIASHIHAHSHTPAHHASPARSPVYPSGVAAHSAGFAQNHAPSRPWVCTPRGCTVLPSGEAAVSRSAGAERGSSKCTHVALRAAMSSSGAFAALRDRGTLAQPLNPLTSSGVHATVIPSGEAAVSHSLDAEWGPSELANAALRAADRSSGASAALRSGQAVAAYELRLSATRVSVLWQSLLGMPWCALSKTVEMAPPRGYILSPRVRLPTPR